MIDYTKFCMSLKHLEAQHENYKTLDTSLPSLIQEAVAESVIQRFETCYDTLWKVLKRHLAQELGIPNTPNSPKPIFKLAYQNGLLRSGCEQWLRYADARVATAHDYSGEKAKASLQIMGDFIGGAIDLYKAMSGTSWE